MKHRISGYIVLLLVGLFFSGCLGGQSSNQEGYYILGSAVTKLSKAVDFVVAFDNPPQEISGQELLQMATMDDPSLLDPFSGYQLKVIRDGSFATLLVCTENGQNAIIEDVTCSAKLDRHAWEEAPSPPCKSILIPSNICSHMD